MSKSLAILLLVAVLAFFSTSAYGLKAAAAQQEASFSLETAPESTTVCVACEFILSFVEKEVENNATEQAIVSALDKACTYLPSSLAGECEFVIGTYGPQIITLLLNKEDPTVICTQIKLCAASVPAVEVAAPTATAECELCELTVQFAEVFIKSDNLTEVEIITKLEGVCAIVPSNYQVICKTVIMVYGPAIVNELISGTPAEQVCTTLKACTASVALAPQGALECEVCSLAVTYIEAFVAKNSTEEEILAGLDKVCSLLPSSVRPTCDGIIATFGPEMIAKILAKEDASTVCAQLGLCSSAAVESVKVASGDNGLECDLCGWIVGVIEEYVANNRTEAYIAQVLDEVCGWLPSSVEAECTSFINTYSAQLLELILNDENPTTVCSQLGLCTSSIRPGFPAGEYKTPASEPQLSTCALCDMVFNNIEDSLENNATDAQVIERVEKACALLPTSYQSLCDNLIEEFGPEIIQLILNKAPPSVICSTLKLCPSSAADVVYTALKASPKKSMVQEASQNLCGICEVAASLVEQYAASPATESAIVAEAAKACSLLPASYQSLCGALVNQYGTTMINQLLADFTPSQVCTAIHLCSA